MTPCTAIIPVSPCVFVPAPEPPETAPEVPCIDRYVGRVHCMDALALMRGLPTGSVDAIVSDPPYNGVKDEDWDNQWPTDAAYLDWLKTVLAEFRRVLKPNGSLYLFASPRMAARVEVAAGEFFNVLNNIRWIKRDGWHKKTDEAILRGYLQPWEAIIFAEQHTSDRQYANLEYELNGAVYQPLKEWFRSRAVQHSITLSQLNAALGAATNGGGLASGYFGNKVEFQLPTIERYQQMQSAFPCAFDRPYEDLRREYEDLRREYEDLRREYEDLRRPFYASEYRPYTDVWEFRTVNTYEGKHPCEKPIAMMEHIILTSTRPGDIVLDPFCGSGATGDAARRHGRRFVMADSAAHWARYAEKRLALPYTPPLPMFA